MGLVRRQWHIQNTYTWIVPGGVTTITAKLVGNGGAGGNVSGTGQGGGGSGGCMVRATLAVTPGEGLTVTIPAFPAGGADGGDVSIMRSATVLALAKGGKHGQSVTSGDGGAGIADTTGCIGDAVFSGGDGSAAAGSASGAGGGGAWDSDGGDASGATAGAAAPNHILGSDGHVVGAQGGAGNTGGNVAGFPSLGYGGGGGGARRTSAGSSLGGRGYLGYLQIEYSVADSIGDSGTAVACDDFTGGDAEDIAGRSLDGCGGAGTGTWAKIFEAPESGQDLGILSGAAVRRSGFVEVCYTVEGLATFPNPYHGVRLNLRFPSRDTITVPPTNTLIWEDTFSGVSGSLNGRVHDGGSAGVGTWERFDPLDGPDAELDGSGNVIQPSSGATFPEAHYAIRGLTLPPRAQYTIEIEVERYLDTTLGEDGTGHVGIYKFVQPVGWQHSSQAGAWLTHASGLDLHGHEVYAHWKGAWSNNPQEVGAVFTGSDVDPPGNHAINYPDTKVIELRDDGTYLTTFIGGTPGGRDGKPGASIYDGIFTTPTGFVTGDPGLYCNIPGTGYRIKSYRIYQYSPGTVGAAFEYGYAEALLRYDTATEVGYRATWEFSHFSTTPVLELTIWLEDSDNGFWKLAYRFVDVVSIAHDTEYVADAWIANDPDTGDDTLYAAFNGVTILQYNLTETVSESDLDPVPEVVASGLPGLQVYDDNSGADEPYVEVLRWRAMIVTIGAPCVPFDDDPCMPCSGPPENPYPTEPPPPPPVTSDLVYGYLMDMGAWRPVLIPLTDVQAGDIYAQDFLELRRGTGIAIMDYGAWRYPVTGIDDGPDPGQPGGHNPYSDPCETINPENPDQVPPPTDVTPVPYAGGRFFGFAGMPTTAIGTLYNGTQRGITSGTGELSQVQARGGAELGNVSTPRESLLSRGNYSRSTIEAHYAGPIGALASSLLTFFLGGTLVGIMLPDDFRSPRLWPPNGISDNEMSILAIYLASRVPGVPIAVRGRPSMFPRPLSVVTIYIAQQDGPPQMHKQIGQTVTEADFRTWRNVDGATLRAFNSRDSGNRVMVIHPNWLHGGDGESGVQVFNGTLFSGRYMMSPAETIRCADAWFGDDGGGYADLMIGSTGYQWLPPPSNPNLFTTQAGMVDAITYFRNGLMGLPPL